LRQMGVDEIHIGKKQKFLTVVCNLETGEPLWFARERNVGRILGGRVEHSPAAWYRSGLRGHMGAFSVEPGAVGSELSDRV
jgi:hypothetical protein